MSSTSTQNAGTATTRSANPKPIGASSDQPLPPARDLLAHQILPGHPEMQPPRRQLPRDLARGQQHQLDPLDPLDRAAILPPDAAPRHRHAARPEPGDRVLLQPALRRHPELQHAGQRHQRLGPDHAADRRHPAPAPEHPGQRVVPPAARHRRQVVPPARQRPEHEPVVIFQRRPPEARLEPQPLRRDPPRCEARPAAPRTARPPPRTRGRPRASPRSAASAAVAVPLTASTASIHATSAARQRRRRRLLRQPRGSAPTTSLGIAQPDARRRRDQRRHPPLALGRDQPRARPLHRGVRHAVAAPAAHGTAPAARHAAAAPPCARPAVSSASIAARISPRSPVTSSTGASPSASTHQRQHLGVALGRIALAEDLEPGLQILPRPRRAPLLPPPDRPAIDVPRRISAPPSMCSRAIGTVKSGRSISSAPSSRVTNARARISSP